MTRDPSVSVLYVDGDDERRGLVADALRTAGFVVESASSAALAREDRLYERFDLVLVNHSLPDSTGLEFIQRTAASDALPAYVMVSDSNDTSLAVAAMRAGALDVLHSEPEDEFLRVLPVVLSNAVNRATLRRHGRDLQDELRHADRKFSKALQSSPIPTLLVDANETLHMVNQAWREAIGVTSVAGMTLDRLLDVTFANPVEVHKSLVITADSPHGETTLIVGVKTMTEQEKTWRLHLARLDNADDVENVPLLICHGLDITDTMLLETRLRNLSLEDALTGLPNRRSLQDRLPLEVARSRRDRGQLAVAMIDIDFFKPYNDRYGHLEGDRCLREVAQAIRSSLRRPADYAARFGGEEFAAILPGVDEAGAREVFEGMRKAVEALGIPHDASDVAPVVTISIGYATLEGSADYDATLILAAADHALFAAKSGGRNRVEQAPSTEDVEQPPSTEHPKDR